MPAHEFTPTTLSLFSSMSTLIESSLITPDPSLDACLAASKAANLDPISVAPNEGKFLYLLTLLSRSKRVLEIGTLGGYSALWFAKAISPLKGGKIISLELSEEHAQIARVNISNAGYSETVEVRVGPALESLAAMKANEEGDFDLVFIDADKSQNVQYLEYALFLGKVGTVIVVDNVVRHGKVVNDDDAASKGVRAAFEWLRRCEKIQATALQTVGPKGWDGMVLGVVVE